MFQSKLPLNPAGNPSTGGRDNGLGLAISKDFIEAQKGEIFWESELGIGSKFGFKLPKPDI